MKKLTALTTLAFLLTVSAIPVSASSAPTLDKAELKQLQKQVYELVKTHHENEIGHLSLEKKYNAIFAKYPELKSQYEASLDASHKDKVNAKIKEMGGLTLTGNASQTIQMDDGSFVVFSNKTTPDSTSETDGGVISPMLSGDTGAQTNTATSGQSFTNDAQFSIWGAYKAVEAHLVTNYKVYSTYITINSASIAGTTAYYPTSVTGAATINTNGARESVSHADYTQTDWLVYGAVPGDTMNYGMDTYLTVKYAGGGTITFTAESKYYGG